VSSFEIARVRQRQNLLFLVDPDVISAGIQPQRAGILEG
jgi:hypothetical protein